MFSQARAGEACGVDNRIFTIKNLQLSSSSSSNEITLSLWGRVMHKIVKIIYGMKLQFSLKAILHEELCKVI